MESEVDSYTDELVIRGYHKRQKVGMANYKVWLIIKFGEFTYFAKLGSSKAYVYNLLSYLLILYATTLIALRYRQTLATQKFCYLRYYICKESAIEVQV